MHVYCYIKSGQKVSECDRPRTVMKKVGRATAKLDLHVGPLFCLQMSDLGLVLHVVYISQTTRQKVDWVEFLQSKMWTCSCSPKVNLAFFCINVHNVSIAEYGSTLYVKIALAVFLL